MADLPLAPDTVSYNCDCEGEGIATKTLLELRQDMLIEAGMNQQLAGVTTGTTLRLNRILDRAQRFLFGEYEEMRNVRMFTWDLVEGVRFYDLDANADLCTKLLSPGNIQWAGVSVGGAWQPLGYGIPPEFYHDPETTGVPNRYEIRQCIEVFPTPSDDSMRLRIKGQFGLGSFTEDADTTTIDPDAIFHWAMSMYLRKSDPQTADYHAGAAMQIVEHRRAAGHGTARYIPGTVIESPVPRPRFLPLE